MSRIKVGVQHVQYIKNRNNVAGCFLGDFLISGGESGS